MRSLRFIKKLLGRTRSFVLVFLVAGLVFSCSPQENKQAGQKYEVRQGEVKMYHNRPTVFINGEPATPLLYVLVDRRFSWFPLPQQNIKQFADIAGIKLFQIDVYLDDVWFSDDSFKLDTAVMQLRGVLDVVPDAAIFMRLHVNAPRWWQAKHPEESVEYGDTVAVGKGDPTQTWLEGDVYNVSRFSLASQKWISSASAMVSRFCRELSATPEGNALVGIQVASGVYGEWHYFGFMNNDPDLSVPMTRYFREWLKRKYKTEAALQKAWASGRVTFETAEVPGSLERNTTRYGVFRDPEKERKVIDYFEAQHVLVAEDILHFCKLVKESWPRPIITGSFYGYFYSLFGREAAGGHLAIDTILKSPYIDYLASPQAYYPDHEATGDPYHSRALLESIRLNGKLFLEEMDQAPPLTEEDDPGYAASLKESISLVRRNTMHTATKGMGMWFYDFGLPSSGIDPEKEWRKQKITDGFWNRPDMMEDIRKIKEVLDENLNSPYVSDADVLMVYDTRSFYALVSQANKTVITDVLINWTLTNAMKAGIVFDAVYLSDLDKVDLSRYKVVVFNNTFVLNESQRNLIRDKVMKDKRDIIWFYAPGYSDGTKLDPAYVSELTGMNLSLADNATLPVIKTTALTGKPTILDIRRKPVKAAGKPLSVRINKDFPWHPLFYVNDKDALSLGVYASDNKTAIAKKELGDCTSWYVALPSYDPALMRGLLERSRAHIFNRDGVIVYSGSGLLSAHTKNRGVKEITLRNGKVVVLNMDDNSTFILNNITGEVLLGNVVSGKK
ncbi:MAG: hypothetical protein M9933_09820 [Chitinophagaceae bacterium]|nr:hypothetical protein [Chitinophagaceae bacterium]